MSNATLDRVERLQEQEATKRTTAWMELVSALVDGDLPKADKVAAIFRDCGKCRADLERDGALLREYRAEQAHLAKVPDLAQREVELATKMGDALAARNAAEQALREAELAMQRVDTEHTAALRALKAARGAAQRLQHPKFHALDRDVSPKSLPEQQLLEEIKKAEAKLAELPELIAEKRRALAGVEGRRDGIVANELPRPERTAQLSQLVSDAQSTEYVMDRLLAQEHHLRRDLARLRRELKSMQSS